VPSMQPCSPSVFDIIEQRRIMKKLDFNNFMDDNWGLVRDTERLIKKFGWYKGDFFHQWISGLINKKLKNPNATFRDLKAAGHPDFICLWHQPEHPIR
jgi:NTE family protein